MSLEPAARCWALLRNAGNTPSSFEVPSRPAGVNADAGQVRYALGSNGEGRLLLPLSMSERVPPIPETPTLRILEDTYSFGGESWRFLDLSCLPIELEGVFGEVADEIVDRISQGHGAVRACVETLTEFRQLLVPVKSNVSSEEIVGLLGELLLLRRLIDRDVCACEIWRGPLGERHDFRAGKLAIEVKTSSRAGDDTVPISAIDQLLEPDGGELCIVRYSLERTAGGEMTVAALSRQILRRIGDPLKFRDLLARMGCTDPMSAEWNTAAYDLQDTRAYRVNHAFPRIVPGSLVVGGMPHGTAGLKYTVDLAAAFHARMTVMETDDLLGRMISCASPN